MLAPMGPGQSISMTDEGWRTDIHPDGFGGSPHESHHTYTAAMTMPAGTVLSQNDFPGIVQMTLNFE
eukprot:6146416-Prymnesium_polylepis.1